MFHVPNTNAWYPVVANKDNLICKVLHYISHYKPCVQGQQLLMLSFQIFYIDSEDNFILFDHHNQVYILFAIENSIYLCILYHPQHQYQPL